MSSSQPPEGSSTPEHGPYGQPSYGQPPQQPSQPGVYGQPSYGQPPQQPPQPGVYGQPSHGQPPQGPPGGGHQPEFLTGGSGGGRNSRRGLVAGSVAVASVLILGGVSFGAYSFLSGAGDSPAEAIPANAIAYARIDLDPSAGQKVNLFSLLDRFPAFEESTGISSDREDLRRLVVDGLLEDLDCGLTYQDDFEPWVGDRAGFAAVPVGDTAAPVISIEVRDEAAAQRAVDAIGACGVLGDGDQPGVDFVGEYMVLTEGEHRPTVMDGLADESLSDNEAFQEDMSTLGEQGVLSYWMDVDGLRDIPEFAAQIEEGPTAGLYDGYHSAFGALRAGDDYIELFNSARTDDELTDERTPVGELPESTMVAASLSGGGDLVTRYWGDVEALLDSASGGYAEQELQSFEHGSGLSIPEDLVTLLGDSITMSMTPDGLEPETLTREDPSQLDLGARFVTDAEALESIVTQLEELAGQQGADVDLVVSETDDGLVLGSNQEYADEVAEGGDLGGSDTFRTAVPNADDSLGVLYVDLDKVHEVAQRFSEQGSNKAARYLEPMQAFGFSVIQRDGHVDTVLRVTFD